MMVDIPAPARHKHVMYLTSSVGGDDVYAQCAYLGCGYTLNEEDLLRILFSYDTKHVWQTFEDANKLTQQQYKKFKETKRETLL